MSTEKYRIENWILKQDKMKVETAKTKIIRVVAGIPFLNIKVAEILGNDNEY